MRRTQTVICISALTSMVLAAGLALVAAPADAGALFGVRSNASESGLYRIDPDTAETHFLAAVTAPPHTNFAEISGIAFHPTTGVLYAVGFKTPPFDHVLLTIDPATGAAAVVGQTNVTSFSGCREISDISFRSDGTLYAYADGCNRVGILNTVTGALALLGPSEVRGAGNGIAFSATDVLYHANDKTVNVLDQTSGRATIGPPLNFRLPGEDSCPGDADVNALSFDPETGRLFGVVNCADVVHRLATIAVATGDVEVNGTVGDMSAIAFRPECQIVGTVQKIGVDKNGQISAHLACEAQAVGLRSTYARVTSLLRRPAGEENVFARANDVSPLEQVCLKQRSGSDAAAKYEATIPETDRRARSTVLSVSVKRKDIKAEDCVAGRPCSAYDSEIRLDRGRIGDTSDAAGECRFDTVVEIIAGTLSGADGTCPAQEGTPVLGVSATADWQNVDQGDCNPPKLRTPVR